MDGKSLQHPLKFCFLKSDSDKAINNNQAKETIRSAVSNEILKLLSGAHQLNGDAVEPSDIAILTRSNREAHDMRSDLSDLGIPSVIYSDQTVFETEEASTFQILLNVLLEPSRLDWIRGLYVTSWFDWSAKQVLECDWMEIQEGYISFHQLWQDEGILNALEAWIRWSNIKPILLGQIAGERSLTNLLHLIELCGKAEFEMKLSPLPLIQWLAESMTDPDKERDDFITRLESDDQAVQIVTIHKSKGLQYPIVFVPFAWNTPLGRSGETWIYHKQDHNDRLVFDNRAEPGKEDAFQYHKETLSDAVRLLYVALTRAESSCYLFWGDFKGQESSSIGHLMGLDCLAGEVEHLTPSQAFDAFQDKSVNGIEILDVDTMTESFDQSYNRYESIGELTCRKLSQQPARGFQISSFSSIATGFREAIEDHLVEDEEGEKWKRVKKQHLPSFHSPKVRYPGT